MEQVDVLVVGSGPAGLMASVTAARAGARVMLVDRNGRPGGQLFKQIHKFFGAARHYAGTRGFRIALELMGEVEAAGIDLRLGTMAWGLFEPLAVGLSDDRRVYEVQAKAVVVATGSSEKPLAFPGWTLPGVMGAGAIQTMMNVHRVLPGKSVLMVGSGNVGLIVSYQLLQAGAEVVAVVEALPSIGGWAVHASKLRRRGVPILTGHSIVEVAGEESVERAKIAQVDGSFRVIPGTEKWLGVDTVCLAVGLTPLSDLLWLAGAQFVYEGCLGGFVPVLDRDMQSSVPGLFSAGDAAGIEEASVAMEQGRAAGLAAARVAGYELEGHERIRAEALRSLEDLRSGPKGETLAAAFADVQCVAAGQAKLPVVQQRLVE